ncbi:MAG: foldase, partial [Cytophagales bacterium]|nr:foldase [Cytophagales bacterium]
MALINTLRDKAGKVVVIALTITMASFVLTDLFSNSSLLTGQDREIAEIDGNEITYEDFQAKVNELSYIHSINTGRSPQGDEVDRIKDQAWQSMLVRMAYYPQYRALGMSVSQAESVDMVQGDNTHPHVIQMLGNPQTGEFDKASVSQILQQINQSEDQQRESWIRFENTLAPSRQMMQLDVIMDKTNYVTSAEGKSEHMSQNSSATIEYVYVPFNSITDSTIEVTNDELKEYLGANVEQYQREESRDVSYVTFSITASAEDSAIVVQEIEEVASGLITTEDDSLFAATNTDGA